MSNAPVSQGPHQRRKSMGLSAAVIVLLSGGGWGLSTLNGGEHTQGPRVKIGCSAVFSVNSCTSTSPPSPAEPGLDQGKRNIGPQLIPAQDVRAHVLDRRDGPAIVRSTPSVNGHFLYTLDPYHHPTQIKIICQAWAGVVQPANGPPTALWDRIGPDEWISDAYLDTGSSRPVTKKCEQPPDEGQSTDGDTTTPG
ncbi:hypothetical protein ABR737_00155 [Streptomyces sp. Edi2]|uniref:hypothetical protein n=1 Tax=Streptomyces sp. Edi2 TaxID=3162528 RepID=UPI0033063223